MACPANGYTIGIQRIDYTPHYNFMPSNNPDFFNLFIEWITLETGCKFQITALPIKRLNIIFEKRRIDFIYPDNPIWHEHKPLKITRYYSPSIATALGTTMVKKEFKNISLADFNELAIPRGFSPVAWYPLQKKHLIKFREVSNAEAALRMVQAGRVDGADIEYNVAQHIVRTKKLEPLVVGAKLPYTPTGFHLATADHPNMLNVINDLINNNQDKLDQMRKSVNLIEAIPTHRSQ